MGNIVLLDELTINKIAAGEVIERPASVIKEMVENSIDAGATNITVEIKNGGISYIKVTDNGKGIAQDDLEIAFERHATSKIRSAEDLNTVTSMGFRGEALASIAAISKVELVSKTKEQDTGYKVVVEAGDVLEKEETGCQNGTSITVRNLFFNTPVRYKFLKKDYTESGYIEDAITRIALVNPNISIKLINTGKTVIQTNGSGNLKDVVYSIYGKDVANGINETTYKYEDITVTGVVGKPQIARSNRSNQLFFVNKRYIKDKTLSAATEQAYKGLIPIGKFGFVILNIEMNPAKVDVNVHPAKLEVRFQEESKVFQAIYHTIKDTLLKSELVANTEKPSNQIERTAESFEERLKNIRENAKQNEGLFSFRKQREKQIEQYTNEESKIKTNVAEAKPEIKQENMSVEPKTEKIGNPLNTSDILLQLKQMKEKMEEEIKNTSTLKEEKEDYELENSENDVNGKIDNNEDANADAKLNENNNDNSEEKVNIKTDNNEENTNKEEQENANSKQEENISEEKNGTIDDANAIIENIDDPEIQKEFEEIKGKMQDLNDNPQVVSEDFNEMYAKLFGRVPIQEETENKEQEEATTDAVDIIKDNISVFEGQEEAKKPEYKFIGVVFILLSVLFYLNLTCIRALCCLIPYISIRLVITYAPSGLHCYCLVLISSKCKLFNSHINQLTGIIICCPYNFNILCRCIISNIHTQCVPNHIICTGHGCSACNIEYYSIRTKSLSISCIYTDCLSCHISSCCNAAICY